MDRILSIEEIQKQYPRQWVIVVDPVLDRHAKVRRGKVLIHNKDRRKVDRALLREKPARWASLYTGVLPLDAAVVL